MKSKFTIGPIVCLLFFILFYNQKSYSQCFEIESILVAACGSPEGQNEMVRFKVGAAALNTNNLNVDWPNNNWEGLIKNTATAAKVTLMNTAIQAAGGCGGLVEPGSDNILPAGATVILVTSNLMSVDANPFGALTETVYILFQDSDATSGHFVNYGTTPANNLLRTLEMNFGSCTDEVTYNRSLLVTQEGTPGGEAGATVLFAASGTPSYVNYGCSAPVPPFTVDAGNSTINACAGTTISLSGTALGQQSVSWTSATGNFSSGSTLSTNYTIPANAAGQTIILTLTATNSCGLDIADTISLGVIASTTPTFALANTICSGTVAPILPTTSTNGITGTWSPSVINTASNGSYVFTPSVGQCAVPFTLNIAITDGTIPTFAIANTICSGTAAPILPTTSTNGITGTWLPSVINTASDESYIFTPSAGQCAVPFTLNITITDGTTPTFAIANTICSGTAAPTLPATSANGITGTWSPSLIDTASDGSYVFTPSAGQCAIPFTLNITITDGATPTFAIANTVCSGTTAPILPTTSTNGITGTWLPSVINTASDESYIFTPSAGQCAVPFTLNITITDSIQPIFDILATFCSGTAAPILPLTSNNGITGTWSPDTINNTANGTYMFTPTAGQCGEIFTLGVIVTENVTPDFDTALTICSGQSVPDLETVSPNGIAGTWTPSSIDSRASGTYIFTPDAGQCATSTALQVSLGTFGIDFEQDCVNGQYMVSALPEAGSFDPGNVTYLWKNGNGNVVGMNEEMLNITALMQLNAISFPATFQVTVFSASGCSATEEVVVNGAFCKIPKGISPNNDSSNDSFDLTGLGVDEIKIYNRYGTEVYSQRNYTNQWAGQSEKGHELPDATYFYVIKKNTGENLTGWVYINR